MKKFDGNKIRLKILKELKARVLKLDGTPTVAILWVGDDKISARYVEAKQRTAELIGVHFDLIKYSSTVHESIIVKKVIELNQDDFVTAIMVQLPLPKNINLLSVIEAIDYTKDVDGLRYCASMTCNASPPVTLAILEALAFCHFDYKKNSLAIIGKGFLVGSPLYRMLKNRIKDIRVVDSNTPYIGTVTIDADAIISVAGVANIINPKMVKDGAILIDAGTSEFEGQLRGDIDPKAYKKSSYYTPVPGGIGPVAVAMLFKNLVEMAEGRLKHDHDH